MVNGGCRLRARRPGASMAAVRPLLASLAAIATLLVCPAAALAQQARPIQEGPEASGPERFLGAPATPQAVAAPQPPRHPFMAPNGRSVLHEDAYMTDTHFGPGPLGRDMSTLSTFLVSECASITFDSRDRLVSICVGLDRPTLSLFDPRTLERLASMPLPERQAGGSVNPFNDFSGGGYFYLDERDRAIFPTNDRHLYVVGQTPEPGFVLERDYDLNPVVPSNDRINSALPDYSGRIWFVTVGGLVGTLDPASGALHVERLLAEGITNSFSVDETGGVYVVSDAALYRFEAGPSGEPKVVWREAYDDSGIRKPGQSDAGSGTTPTLMGKEFVSITDNADPMNVVVYRRSATVAGSRVVCKQPVFEQGASATDNSLIGTERSMVVENNFGYSGPGATTQGGVTSPGIERVDIDRDGKGCHTVWKSGVRAPSVVPKLSLANGLVYTYTKEPREDDTDAWYLTALDFRTGRTVYSRLAGTGLGFNNNYAPITIGPDGTVYVGVLGGMARLADAVPPGSGSPPPGPPASGPRPGQRPLNLSIRLEGRKGRTSSGRSCFRSVTRARLAGSGVDRVQRAVFKVNGRPAGRDQRPPFRVPIEPRLLRFGRANVLAITGRSRGSAFVTFLEFRMCARTSRAPRFTG